MSLMIMHRTTAICTQNRLVHGMPRDVKLSAI